MTTAPTALDNGIKRAAFVTIEACNGFTGQRQLEIYYYPFAVDCSLALCHRCARDSAHCDLDEFELSEVTVVQCEVREILDRLSKETTDCNASTR